MPKLRTTLLTGRTIYQGVGKELGKLSEEYFYSISICEINPEDLAFLGIKENDNVRVTTKFGSIVLTAVDSGETHRSGAIFIPYGPFANILIGSNTDGTGMPSYKGLLACVEPAKEEKPMKIPDLLKTIYGR